MPPGDIWQRPENTGSITTVGRRDGATGVQWMESRAHRTATSSKHIIQLNKVEKLSADKEGIRIKQTSKKFNCNVLDLSNKMQLYITHVITN